jgi:hypothetical protein
MTGSLNSPGELAPPGYFDRMGRMVKFAIYAKLTGLFILSMFLPTSPLTSRIERLLAELKIDQKPLGPRT